jgi:diguanylate cyclase (GGDEF)-like protein
LESRVKGPARLLIVEDQPAAARELSGALELLGYVVIGTATSSEEAVRQTAQLQPDLVLMDISLDGECDGIETAAILQSRFQVPVVYVTANVDPHVLERALHTDPHGYLAKPYNHRTLGATIEVALRRHESELMLRGYSEDLARRRLELERKSQELGALAESFRQQSILDPLTALYNRRHLDSVLTRELSLAQRESHPVGLIMLDVDHFKVFNDTFGHETGDRVLQEISRLIRSRLRAYDVPCRYGGEEISIVLPGALLSDGCSVAEHLRSGIEKLTVDNNGRSIGTVTASFGVAAFPEQATEPAELLRAADEAMYEAKRQGRNRVVAASRAESATPAKPG